MIKVNTEYQTVKTEKTFYHNIIMIRELKTMTTQNLNFIERIEKAEQLLINRIARGKNKQIANDFKKLVSGLNISREFLIKDLIKQNLISNRKKLSFEKKINNFIEIAEIKTTNAFFYKDNGLNQKTTIECFVLLL